jgi:hypothetical protein
MNIEELELEIEFSEAIMLPLKNKLSKLREDLRSEKSKEFIRVNGITIDDVEDPDGPARPYFGHVSIFGKWLKSNSSKPWASWNGMILRTSDLVAGKFIETPARVEDLT